MAGTINGFAPARLRISTTDSTMRCMSVIPRLPTATAMRAPGFKRVCTLANCCWTTARTSTGGDFGKCCRTTRVLGKELAGILTAVHYIQWLVYCCQYGEICQKRFEVAIWMLKALGRSQAG